MTASFLFFAPVILLVMVAVFILKGRSGILKRRKNNNNNKHKQVPGVRASHSRLGNLPDIQAAGSLHQFLVQLHSRFGDVAGFWFGSKHCVSVASARAFRDVQMLFNRPTLFFEFFEQMITSRAMPYANGDEGRRRHKAYSEVLNASSCALVLPKLNQICRDFADSWNGLEKEDHIPLYESMMTLSIRNITMTQFGAYFKREESIKKFHLLYELVWNVMEAKLLGEFPTDDEDREKEFQRNNKMFQDMCRHILKEHKCAREWGDYEEAPLLNALIDNSLDEDTEFADCISFVVGGFHTTGSLLTWLFYFLSENPTVQEKLYEEINKVLDGGEAVLDENNIKELKYMRQVIDETLRVSTLTPFGGRVSNKTLIVDKHKIPASTPILLSYGVAMQNGRVFQNPQKFDPGRFSNVDVAPPSLCASFRPFGVGLRQCPGRYFALHAVYAATVAIVSKLHIYPASTEEDRAPVGRIYSLVTKPDSEIWITVRPREKEKYREQDCEEIQRSNLRSLDISLAQLDTKEKRVEVEEDVRKGSLLFLIKLGLGQKKVDEKNSANKEDKNDLK